MQVKHPFKIKNTFVVLELLNINLHIGVRNIRVRKNFI